jgi:uncharacterized protein
MTLYLDSSSLIKRYVVEEQSEESEALLVADPSWLTAQHTYVEVSLALARRLSGSSLDIARNDFEEDWARTIVTDVDDTLCRRAAELGAVEGTRALDALHLAAAERSGGRSIPIVTFDLRLARAARALGFAVIGV